MFFRRLKPVVNTFDQRVSGLSGLGFSTESAGNGKYRVSRNGFAAILSESDGKTCSEKAGLMIGRDIGHLVNGGYQMFFRTDAGVVRPARAEQLKGLHAFQEDLREGLGEESLYNLSLGTTSELHLYDRLEERDHGVAHKAWQK
jgi:hypothetical protein